MTFVVAHVETVLDQPRHPGTGPQRCREAVGFRAFEKESLQLRELHLAQQRLAAGTPSLRQTGCAAFAVLTHPAAHALLRRFDSPRRFVLAETLFDPSRTALIRRRSNAAKSRFTPFGKPISKRRPPSLNDYLILCGTQSRTASQCKIARNEGKQTSNVRSLKLTMALPVSLCREPWAGNQTAFTNPIRAHCHHTLRTGQARSCPHAGQRKLFEENHRIEGCKLCRLFRHISTF